MILKKSGIHIKKGLISAKHLRPVVCYLLNSGLCLQQHTDGQSAHCLLLGSLTVDAVSLILNSWTLKRGKNHQASFLASPHISPALDCFFFYSPPQQIHPERNALLFISTESLYPP